MKKNKHKYIVGIDEAGRGALCGPVSVAAVAIKILDNKRFKNKTILFQSKKLEALSLLKLQKTDKFKTSRIFLKDSKKLSFNQRETWFNYLCQRKEIFYSVAMVSPKVIDKINVTKAANLAATRAFSRLIKNSKIDNKKIFVKLDGGLYFKNEKSCLKNLDVKTETIIKGDEKVPAIMMASIFAKVKRDRMMIKLHKKFPDYKIDKHKGYGTEKHIKAIKKFGLSSIHRKTFGNFKTKFC
ncbi:ribonuclease HII [Candidatus Wolfebacteria bacterium]|nr:ribonuclease HII [Candidatus Wolfebacteria bacterium]